jgi:type I restriction enzyme R subunit
MTGRTPLFRLVLRALAQSCPNRPQSRRRFIQQLSAATAGTATTSCVSSRQFADNAPIAIVGGGVAGLTAAYRISQKGRPVHLFEASQRCGGRIFTRKNFNADNQFVELGAELVDTGHKDLIRIAKELQALQQRSHQLGLNDDELAFYDALADNKSAINVMGDQQLMVIAKELVGQVRQSITIDWHLRESARATLRVMVKRILRKYRYPPDLQEYAVDTVIEQTEVLCKGW